MIKFKDTMDTHAKEIIRDGKCIGSLLWHPDREERVVLSDSFEHLTIEEMRYCLKELEMAVKTDKETA